MLQSTAKEISAETNPKLAKKVDTKLKDISQRFNKISEKVFKRCQLLEEVIYFFAKNLLYIIYYIICSDKEDI